MGAERQSPATRRRSRQPKQPRLGGAEQLQETLAVLRAMLSPGVELAHQRAQLEALLGRLILLRYQALVETLVFAEVERWSWDVVVRGAAERQAAIQGLVEPVVQLPYLDQLHQQLLAQLDQAHLASDALSALIEQLAADTLARFQAAASYRYRLQLQRVDLAPYLAQIALNLGQDPGA